LPRRLGDDPLARAKASAPVAPVPGGQGGMAQPGIRSSSRASYNDVFFQRRTAGDDQAITGRPQQQVEARSAPEISEISEIPEIREVAALPEVRTDQGVAAIAGAEREPEGAQVVEVQPASAAVAIENTEAVGPSVPVGDLASQVDAVPAAKEGRAGAPVAQLEPEPQNGGGFLKRLFGRFGK
jgi:hypothetical protein